MTHPRSSRLRAAQAALLEARTSPDGFEHALGAIAELVGAHSALAYVPSYDLSTGFAVDMVGWRTQEMHDSAQIESASHGQIDPWRAGGERIGAFAKPTIAVGEELAGAQEFAKSPWGPFFEGFDVRHLLAYVASARELGAPQVVLSLYRATQQGPFSEEDCKLIAALTREFDATAALRLSLSPDAPRLEHTLAAVTDPTFLVERGAVVTWANDAGHALLGHGGLVRLNGNALSAVDHERAEAVSATVLNALHGRSGAVRLAPAGAQHYYLAATPLSVGERTVALVRLRDAHATRTPRAEDLIAVFDFTPAEAAVAVAMCQHLTANEIARLREVDVETVRTQIRRIFSKLHVRKASEAIVILSRLAD
jgi:DNA-binding CsgD family transcriptional regulator